MNNKRSNNHSNHFALLIAFLLSGLLTTGCHNHEDLQVIIKMPCIGDSANHGICRTTDSMSRSIILRGDPDEIFNFKIRIRGIVEQRAYPSGKSKTGMWQVGGREGSRNDTANIYKLGTSNPKKIYYINAGKEGLKRTFKIDTVVTIQSHGEAVLTLTGLSIDGKQVNNQDREGNPIKITSANIKNRPFKGQFVQVDVLSQKKIKGT